MNSLFRGGRAKAAGVAVAVVLVISLVYGIRRSVTPTIGNADEGDFLLVEATDRELDGSPALALTFTLPLDSRKSYDKFIQVFEMPTPATKPPEPRRFVFEDEESSQGKGGTIVSTKPEDTNTQGGAVISGAWTVGENPRLLFFPHIKPQTR